MGKKITDQAVREAYEELRVAMEKFRAAVFAQIEQAEQRSVKVREQEQRIAELEGAVAHTASERDDAQRQVVEAERRARGDTRAPAAKRATRKRTTSRSRAKR